MENKEVCVDDKKTEDISEDCDDFSGINKSDLEDFELIGIHIYVHVVEVSNNCSKCSVYFTCINNNMVFTESSTPNRTLLSAIIKIIEYVADLDHIVICLSNETIYKQLRDDDSFIENTDLIKTIKKLKKDNKHTISFKITSLHDSNMKKAARLMKFN